MWSDPDWINYTQESAKLGALESQENKLLKQQITQLENKLRVLNVVFEQETGREAVI